MGKFEFQFVLERRKPKGAKQATNLTLDKALVEQARGLGLNLSAICEAAVSEAVSSEKARRWAEENADAITEHNAHVDAHGLLLAKHRSF